MENHISNALKSLGWLELKSSTAIARRQYTSITGPKEVLVYLSRGDEYCRTLSGTFYQGINNLLGACSVLIPHGADMAEIMKLAKEFTDNVDQEVNDFFTVRLAREDNHA